MSVKERLEDYLKGYQSQYNFVGEDKIEHTLDSDIKSLLKENENLKRQLEYLRSGEYLNQLKFERNMLEDIVQNGGVSKEDKEFIDMTHRNTELLEKIDKAIKHIKTEKKLYDMCWSVAKDEYEEIFEPPLHICEELLEILGGDVDDE